MVVAGPRAEWRGVTHLAKGFRRGSSHNLRKPISLSSMYVSPTAPVLGPVALAVRPVPHACDGCS